MAHLTQLGLLRELTTEERTLSWPRSSAPILAYDARGRLAIVYDERFLRAATAKEKRAYASTHWGLTGEGETVEGEIAMPPFRVIGVSRSIVYETRKGLDSKPVEYEHEWGEGVEHAFRCPVVEEHVCNARKCPMSGTVRLRGGTYRVTPRGIVG